MLDLGTEDMVVLGVAVGVFVVVLALSLATTRDDRLAERIRSVSSVTGRRSTGSATRRNATGRKAMIALMRRTVSRLNLIGSTQAQEATDKLARAGWRSKDALVVYLFTRLCLPLLVGGTAVIAVYVLELFTIQPLFKLGGVLACVMVGFLMPNIYVNNMITRRREKLRKTLPDTVDLMVICTEAGLSLDATLVRVAREIAGTAPEMADEIVVVSNELAYLGDRQTSLDNWKRRVDLPAIHALCTTLLQTEKFGTPLAQALRVLAQEQRDERMLRAEEKAARLPAVMTIPLIVCILPALFVVVLGPAILNIMDALVKM